MGMTIGERPDRIKQGWPIGILLFGALGVFLHLLFALWWKDLSKWPLLIVIAVSAIPLIWQIGVKLFHKNLGADVLAALSIIAAFALGQYLACVLVIMMLAGGQALEGFALGRASTVLNELSKRIPAIARRKRDGRIEDIKLEDIAIGDLLVIGPHETSPADGVVEMGHGFMDESYLTGEPYRAAKAPGSSVLSGSINGETMLLVRASKLPQDSRYASIMKVMAEAEQKRPRLRRLGDQLGAIFTPISLAVAIGAWVFSSDPLRFLSVLVIATPCPLLIAIPVALISAISLAARRGMIISDPVILEMLPRCKTAIFDKTGTLTYGRPTLTEVMTAAGFTRDEVMIKTASLEQYSKHPLAKAIVRATAGENLSLIEATNVSEEPGHGLMGEVGDSAVLITGRQQLLRHRPDLSRALPPATSGLECVVMFGDEYAACLRFHDAPKKDSLRFVKHLKPFHAFEKVMLLSGDRESEVMYFARQLGIEQMLSSQTPEQKLEVVRREAKKAPTMFMGDGINDAPALRAATVGIAFGEPASVAMKAAGAVVLENTLLKVDELIHLSKLMRAIALQSAVGGMALSFIGMGFASLGLISPVAGALLQQGIDAVAIVNSLRLTWQRDIKIDMPS